MGGTGSPDTVGRPEGPRPLQPKYEDRRRLPHYQKDNHPLFVTFTTDRRRAAPPAARAIALECWVKQSGRKFELHAVVVMPDPVHWIYSPLPRSDGWSYSLPEIMKAIKGRSAREINVALKPSCSGWQAEFFDYVLRSNDSLVGRLD